jgi:hypothetical protein
MTDRSVIVCHLSITFSVDVCMRTSTCAAVAVAATTAAQAANLPIPPVVQLPCTALVLAAGLASVQEQQLALNGGSAAAPVDAQAGSVEDGEAYYAAVRDAQRELDAANCAGNGARPREQRRRQGTADTTPADTIPADTIPADTIPADTIPADTIPADTVQSSLSRLRAANRMALTATSLLNDSRATGEDASTMTQSCSLACGSGSESAAASSAVGSWSSSSSEGSVDAHGGLPHNNHTTAFTASAFPGGQLVIAPEQVELLALANAMAPATTPAACDRVSTDANTLYELD